MAATEEKMKTPQEAKEVSLPLAIVLTSASWLLQFVIIWSKSYGFQTLSKIGAAFNHPQALLELAAEAAGASLVFPLVHLAIASIFKSKRNSNSRRRIFIGWAIVTTIVGLLPLVTRGGRF